MAREMGKSAGRDHRKPRKKAIALGTLNVLTVLGAIAVSWLIVALIVNGGMRLFRGFF
jgi:hypothetical protein